MPINIQKWHDFLFCMYTSLAYGLDEFVNIFLVRHNIMLLWFVKIYERNQKKLQFTTQRFDTLSDLSAVTCFLLCSTLGGDIID